MNNFNKILSLGVVALSLTLTGCIDETFPESSTVVEKQMSNAGLESAINGLSSQFCQGYLVYGEQEDEKDMAYPQFMIAQTEMLGDMYPEGSNSGYDWYRGFNTISGSLNDNSYYSYLPFRTLYMFIKGANDAIKTFKAMEDPNDENKVLAAQAYGYRAFDYYLAMVLFEPKANEYTDCSKVLGLTVPLVTDETTEDMARNNPRAEHKVLVAQIMEDLDKAESLFLEAGTAGTSGPAPSLAVIKGLQAKVLLWDAGYDEENGNNAGALQTYEKAYAAATSAIEYAEGSNKASMMTKDELTNPSTAFTTAVSSWLWYTHYSAENMGNLCNLTGWLSGEADWGYSSLTMPAIDAALYNKMGVNDYRRMQFLDPDREFGQYETCRTADWIMEMPDYLALKFRCKTGDYETYSTGGAVDVPIMRLEELYLVQADAAAHSLGYEAGAKLLSDWVAKYRDPAYKFTPKDLRDTELAILTQMRLEFWGEGNAFPMAKRIKPGVCQNYDGTNAPSNIFLINFPTIKPNWNIVIPQYEIQSNQALEGYNNPDPTRSKSTIAPVGGYLDPADY